MKGMAVGSLSLLPLLACGVRRSPFYPRGLFLFDKKRGGVFCLGSGYNIVATSAKVTPKGGFCKENLPQQILQTLRLWWTWEHFALNLSWENIWFVMWWSLVLEPRLIFAENWSFFPTKEGPVFEWLNGRLRCRHETLKPLRNPSKPLMNTCHLDLRING